MKKVTKKIVLSIVLSIVCMVNQSVGSESKKDVNNSTPYGGLPWEIPGKIEAEDFDEGGEVVAYREFEAGNLANQYRL